MASQTERDAMRRAIALAAHGLGGTSPNPVVGCVVLGPDGVVVGEGFHERAGNPHAEVVALRAAGQAARGGTAVVTLEPCAHTGRTGPCTRALLDAGVRRVVIAVTDPTPEAHGGADVLRDAGVEVETGVLAAEAEAGNAAWLFAVRHGRPHVTWKFAATLDGRSAAADGTSRWITGPQARADVHRLRAEHDAVLVGSGTLLADDPALTVRDAPVRRQPLRVVVDSRLRTPPSARVLDGAAPTLLATTRTALAAGRAPAGAEVVAAGEGPRVDLPGLLAALYERGIRAVFLEGGPTLAGAFLAAGLVDRVVAYLAPALLGAGPAALGPAGIGTIAELRRLRVEDVRMVGTDLRLTARPTAPMETGDGGVAAAEGLPTAIPDTASGTDGASSVGTPSATDVPRGGTSTPRRVPTTAPVREGS